jgi:hypothetical protein
MAHLLIARNDFSQSEQIRKKPANACASDCLESATGRAYVGSWSRDAVSRTKAIGSERPLGARSAASRAATPHKITPVVCARFSYARPTGGIRAMPECPAELSDYRTLPPDVVATLKERAVRIRATLQRSLMEAGCELTEAKDILSHGQFTAWVERETGLTIRTAQMIMSAYRLCLKNENFSLLPKSALYAR